MLRILLVFLAASAAASFEAYFEFDDRATSVSASPNLFFCRAATAVLTPSADNTAWCLDDAGKYKFIPTIAHGHLTNVRITLPTRPEPLNFGSPIVMSALSERLYIEGFFLSAANVSSVVDYNNDVALNAALTSTTLALLALTICIPKIRNRCCPREAAYEPIPRS